MSKINDSNSLNIEGKSSKVITISKSRLSSGKVESNYMTIFEGNRKITCDIGKESIEKKQIKKVFSTLQETILKYSSSTGKLIKQNKKVNIIPRRNKLNISISSSIGDKKYKGRNVNTRETYNGLITSEKNNENKKNNHSNEIQVIDNDISDNLSEKEKKKEYLETNANINNNLDNEEKDNNKDNEDIDSIDMNLENLKIINIEQINKNIKENNSRNLISQNYFKNSINSKNIIEEYNQLYHSEEMRKQSKQSDKAVKSISEYVSKPNENINLVESEKSDNKKYMNLNKNKNKKNFDSNNLITEERQLKPEEEEEENKKDIISNSNHEEENKYKNYVVQTVEDDDYYNCSICEYSYLESQMFKPECNVHYLCKRCTKNYYEDLIDDGVKELLCPFMQCKKGIDLNKLKTFISEKHYNRLKSYHRDMESLEENKLIFSRLKTEYNKENVELYSKKHVIDISSNKNFYNYKGIKNTICPFCNEETLFKQTNNYFFKCLNCLTKVCQYCMKEYNTKHFDINYPKRCKIYHRFIEASENKTNCFYTFLLQIFFVIAMYYLTFVGIFSLVRNKFFIAFNANKNKISCKCLLAYFFSIIIFIVIIPFIFIIYPYFPSISAIFDNK